LFYTHLKNNIDFSLNQMFRILKPNVSVFLPKEIQSIRSGYDHNYLYDFNDVLNIPIIVPSVYSKRGFFQDLQKNFNTTNLAFVKSDIFLPKGTLIVYNSNTKTESSLKFLIDSIEVFDFIGAKEDSVFRIYKIIPFSKSIDLDSDKEALLNQEAKIEKGIIEPFDFKSENEPRKYFDNSVEAPTKGAVVRLIKQNK